MKKIISIALFGEGVRYSQYLPAFVMAHCNLFPVEEGWQLDIHMDETVAKSIYGKFSCDLQKSGIGVVCAVMSSAPLTQAMLWRMWSIFTPGADYTFCRDIDAAPMPRDKACMETFIQSKAVVHTIHDHEQHTGIMGGLCGFRCNELRELTKWKSLEDFYKAAGSSDAAYSVHGEDQLVLNRLLLKLGGPPLLEHRYNGWFKGPGKFARREPGVYPCPAWSTPVPDIAHGLMGADFLAPHLGSAGYDHEDAVRFWEKYGDPKITEIVKRCLG